MRLITHTAPLTPVGATVAQVTFSEETGYGAVSANEQRGLPVFAPRGMAYRPCEGDNLLLVPAGGANVCAGVLCAAEELEAGEVRLASASGAVIHLRQDGSIVLNGVTITCDGQILPPGGQKEGR